MQENNMKNAHESVKEAKSPFDLHCSHYCEENVWRLANYYLSQQEPTSTGSKHKTGVSYHVIFVSNKKRCCPFMFQKAAKEKEKPVFWDYHVILLSVSSTTTTTIGPDNNHGTQKKNICHIHDLDTLLHPFPCPLDFYLESTFQCVLECFEDPNVRKEYSPLFRVVEAKAYLQHFYSDRMHMFDKVTNTWIKPPPPYKCICDGWSGNECDDKSNLEKYIEIFDDDNGNNCICHDKYGVVLTYDQLKNYFVQ